MQKYLNLSKINSLVMVISLGVLTSGCVVTPLTEAPKLTSQESSTQIQPDRIYLETPESKSVSVGSHLQASLNGCTGMQRYRIRTNSDFLSTLHLFKYRAALMGARRIVIINHTEIDIKELSPNIDKNPILIREGTTLQTSSVITILTADLYECAR
jgi:hypothetical protein